MCISGVKDMSVAMQSQKTEVVSFPLTFDSVSVLSRGAWPFQKQYSIKISLGLNAFFWRKMTLRMGLESEVQSH
jgi:hypothetical protein